MCTAPDECVTHTCTPSACLITQCFSVLFKKHNPSVPFREQLFAMKFKERKVLDLFSLAGKRQQGKRNPSHHTELHCPHGVTGLISGISLFKLF